MIDPKLETIGSKKGNCSLVAVQEVTGASDAEVLRVFRRHGYKDNSGMFQQDYMRAAGELGARFGKITDRYSHLKVKGKSPFEKYSVADFLRDFRSGVFLVRTRGHVFVVRDGKMIDPNWKLRSSLGRSVVDFVEVLNPYKKEVKGFVRVLRSSPRRPGTRGAFVYQQMREYIGRNPQAKKQDIFKCTHYNATDFAWDLQRGNIELY